MPADPERNPDLSVPAEPRACAALIQLLRQAQQLASAVRATGSATGDAEQLRPRLAARLDRSVVRPLQQALERLAANDDAAQAPHQRGEGSASATAAAAAGPVADQQLSEALWRLAQDATRLRVSQELPCELQEAVATLQDLACSPPGDDEGLTAARLTELREMQAELTPCVQTESGGPYLVTNVVNLLNWLGEPVPTRPQMALCRCGRSATKPFCDGTHAEVGFVGDKDPGRVADRRDTYVGQQVTIFDNRGICQHAGFCTSRLETVFRAGKEPFVAPSGGRMDEIIRAVRDCPSGALSFAVDGVEARDEVDHHRQRPPAIEVSKDGPYRVTGAIRLLDDGGLDEQRNEGVSLEHYALCRCGRSQNKPFCSGMHWYVEFKDPPAGGDRGPTIFEWCGGLPALTRMTRLFYERYVPEDPLLAPLFANMSPDHPQRVARWLAEVFCGPKEYSEQYGGYTRMLSQHIGRGLTEEKRARWVQLILKAAQAAGLPADPEFRAAFSSYIEWGSRLALENSQPGATPPEHMPMPHWDWNTAAGPPGSRISALEPAADEEAPALLPHGDEGVSFEKHVRTFFRVRDRRSMQFAFDLWSYDQVKQNAHAILERVRNGSMPCDGAWPQEKVDAFDRWISTGMDP